MNRKTLQIRWITIITSILLILQVLTLNYASNHPIAQVEWVEFYNNMTVRFVRMTAAFMVLTICFPGKMIPYVSICYLSLCGIYAMTFAQKILDIIITIYVLYLAIKYKKYIQPGRAMTVFSNILIFFVQVMMMTIWKNFADNVLSGVLMLIPIMGFLDVYSMYWQETLNSSNEIKLDEELA